MMQTFDKLENLEPPGPIKMHHTIENKSGTGVQVRLHAARMDNVHKLVDDLNHLGMGAARIDGWDSWSLLP
jgi:hypothetical protein